MVRDVIQLDSVSCDTSTGPAVLVAVRKATAPSSLVTYLNECFNAEIDAANTCESL